MPPAPCRGIAPTPPLVQSDHGTCVVLNRRPAFVDPLSDVRPPPTSAEADRPPPQRSGHPDRGAGRPRVGRGLPGLACHRDLGQDGPGSVPPPFRLRALRLGHARHLLLPRLAHTSLEAAALALPHSVDVLVCTYDEGPEVLEATLLGCGGITYPHVTWVLDDGRRDFVRKLAERTGARYVTRPDNCHAKAGNINHALGVVDAELLLVLDADHVPQPDILDATVGYFDDRGSRWSRPPMTSATMTRSSTSRRAVTTRACSST